jgi:HEAT repeat protein
MNEGKDRTGRGEEPAKGPRVDAEGWLPDLLDALRAINCSVSSNQAESLRQRIATWPDGVSSLITALQVPNSAIRLRATIALGLLGPGAAEAIPVLIKCLSDRSPQVQFAVATTLGRIGPDAVPALVGALKDKDWEVKCNAAKAIGEIGPTAAGAVPALIAAFATKEEYVRWYIVDALGEIGPSAPKVVPTLIAALEDRNMHVRWCAVEALGEFGAAARPAVKHLSDSLEDDDITVRWTAAEALGKIGADAIASVPALNAAMQGADPVLRKKAAIAVRRIQSLAAATDRPEVSDQRARVTGSGITISRMAEFLDLISQLQTFVLVGEACRRRGDFSFNFREESRRLKTDDWEVRRHLEVVSRQFRKYFQTHGYPEGTPVVVAADGEFVPAGSGKLKIFDRGRGKRRTRICEPLGRVALELSIAFLQSIGRSVDSGAL